MADQFRYQEHPGYDLSFSRTVDGDGSWTTDYQVTMGQANRPWPAPEPPTAPEPTLTTYEPLTISEARVIKWGTEVTVEGQVTVPPGLFSVETIYIQDGSGGILIYLREGTYPPLKEGDWVRITGEVRDYHGEREIRVEEGGIEFLKDGEAVTPVEIAMAEVEEGKEGLLAEIIGIVTEVEGGAFYLDDGGGEVKVYIREATGIERKIRP